MYERYYMRILVLLSLLSVPLVAQLRAPEVLGKVIVVNTPSGFGVAKDSKIHIVQPDCMDTMLRNLTFKQRNAYLLKGGSIELNQANTGEYTLKSVANIQGGGLLGAKIGFWVGKGVVYLGAYTGIAIAAACTGPLAPVTFSALTAAYAVPIEAASHVGAISGGIIGGVATGPV